MQNDFSVAILGLSKFFREDAAVTAQTMLIGNKPCRIYGEAHAEYLLLQMTGDLKGEIFYNPAIGEWEHKGKFLSGNVIAKCKEIGFPVVAHK